ncbi:MAG: cell division protein FtsL [Pseudomonadota bacterium]|nr:cell division protein FtsL [Pseudomonadota bacterium]
MSAVSNRKFRRSDSVEPVVPPPVLVWLGLASASSALLHALLVSLLVSGLMVVKTTHENRFAFNQLQVLRDEANQLDVEWGQLLLEQSTFGLGGRIEQKATRELQLQVPRISDIVMVNLNEKQP